jgi:hypothetical protein
MNNQESVPGPEVRPIILNIPYYVDTAVLKPGATVYSIHDQDTPMVVVRVEPALVCRKPDGSEVLILASEVSRP